ncbi:MAG TPA: DUF1569 domain-containing protein [Candidatus Acidoferrum sp.]
MGKETLASTADRKVILGRLGKMRPDSPRQWGKMNAHQAVCHLCDSFRGVMGDRTLSGKPFPLGGVIKWVALYAPMKWSRNLPTMPEVDQMKLGTPPVEFAGDVGELDRLVERFSGSPREFTWRPHPFFGEMNERDWMRWGWLHMDHHFRQFGI